MEVTSTKHVIDSTAINSDDGVTCYISGSYTSIAAAEDIADDIAAMDGDTGSWYVCSTGATIDRPYAAFAVVNGNGRCTVSIVSFVAASVNRIDCVCTVRWRRIGSVYIYRYGTLRLTVYVISAKHAA
ncbi:MAG: hypothetical protein BWY95_01868 [Bacteroidetes bacterium ADurb.BinA104]|nr:MAG: hypothetical protein BWY95_01868 [Bacteroidetes bacterium ADurb.BinA104]